MNVPTGHSRYREDLVRTEILALLGREPLNRSQIAARLRLGAATVTEHTRRLLALEYLRELSPQANGPGRPRVPLAVVPDAAYTLGLRVHPTHLVGVLVRLDGSEVERFQFPFNMDEDPVEQLIAACTEVLARPGTGERIRGIGVALPGMIDPVTGTVRISPRLGMTDVELGPILSARLPVPVLIDNDTRASTSAELFYGTGRDHDDFLVLAIGDGVGMGVVLGRRVHHGPEGVAGEFGHIPIDPQGPPCMCGNHGCLEVYAADYSIARRARKRGLAAQDPSPEELYRHAVDDRAGYRELLADTGALLGRAVAGVVNVLAVRALAVIGESHILWPYLEPGFTPAMDASVVTPLRGLDVRVRPWDDSAHARGAASLVLAASLADPPRRN